MTKLCYKCGQPCKKGLPPMSAMGERMYGRGLDPDVCDNVRCEAFGDDQ